MTNQKIIPINVDRNVSAADYRKFDQEDQLLVTGKPFYTIQGEGPLGGYPAVFLRLAGCNIGAKEDCPFCDTRFDFDKGNVYTFGEMLDALEREAAERTNLIVVTGGEPLLQQNTLGRFIQYTNTQNAGLRFQIETNGYFVKPDTFSGHEIQYNIEPPLIVISPKVAATRGEYNKPRDSWFANSGVNRVYTTALKYVVSADPESPYHEIPADVIDRCKETGTDLFVSGMAIYLKSYPEGRISSIWHTDEIDQIATGENYRYAAQYAMKHGLRLSYQTHLFGAID